MALAAPGKRCSIILNALDNAREARDRFLKSQTDALAKLGFATQELDLRLYFNRGSALERLLGDVDLVWINGGNTFILRRAMRQSGFDVLIDRLLRKDRLVYAGFSAAAVIAAPDLHGLDITDDPSDAPEGYDPETVWTGLGLIAHSIAVHYKSDHSESALTEKEIAYYQSHGIPYKALRDGEVLVIDGDHAEILS